MPQGEVISPVLEIKNSLAVEGIQIVSPKISDEISKNFNLTYEYNNLEAMEQLALLFDIDAIIKVNRGEDGLYLKAVSTIKRKTIFEYTYKTEQFIAQAKLEPKKEKVQFHIKKEEKPKTKNLVKKDKKNSIGILFGPGAYKSNFKDFKTLKDNNSGAKAYHNVLSLNAEVFYKRKTSDSFSLILTAGSRELGSEEYMQSGMRMDIESESKYVNLGFNKKLWKRISFSFGAGADFIKYSLTDPAPLSGINIEHGGFENTARGFHLGTGLAYSPGNFILKIGVEKLFMSGENNFTGTVSGGPYAPGEYNVIIRNDSSIDFKKSSEQLASNEKYLKAELGGIQVFILFGYKFNF